MAYDRGSNARLVFVVVAAIGCVVPLTAQEQSDERANRDLVVAFESNLNRHDIATWGTLFTEDVDYVGVSGWPTKGRAEVVQDHTESHASVIFKDAVFTVRNVTVAFLKPDVALLHIDWGLVGDRYPDGRPGKPREGVLTWVTIKDGDAWKIRAVHNSSHDLDQ